MIHARPALILALLLSLAGLSRGDIAPKGPQAVMRLPHHAAAPPAIDADSTLSYDDGLPAYYFWLPDQFDDHYFNVRFSAGDSCRLLQAAFLFMQLPNDTTSTLPDVHVLVWPSSGLLPSVFPSQALDSINIADEDLIICPDDTTWDTMYVSLEALDLHFGGSQQFHLGWEPDSTDSTDGPLAILADDGIPETTNSCEWWGGNPGGASWGTVQSDWGISFNFMIRVWVELFDVAGTRIWLDPVIPDAFALQGPYPNPFNPQTSLQIDLPSPQNVSLEVYDLTGRLVDQILTAALPAGRNHVSWRPPGLSSGLYIVMLKSETQSSVVRAQLIK
jgi:hypothetical protein